MGATALSASVAAPSIEAGLLRPVGLALPERDFHVLRHTERYRSRPAEALLALLLAIGGPRAPGHRFRRCPAPGSARS